jgi:branched-chain amino acid transport system permease protein
MTGRRNQLISLAAAALLLATVPFAGASNQLLQTLTVALIFAIPAVGLGLLYGEAGQMSVANGALFGIGAYTAGIGAREQFLSMWPALGTGAVLAAAAALLIGLTALRVRGHYFLILTFAFAELWRICTVNLRSWTGGNQGVMVLEPATIPGVGEIESLRAFFYLALAAVIVASCIVVVLRWSAFGRSLRAVRENERLAISLGLNAALARLVAFAISGALAGAGGVIYAYHLKHVGPESFGATAGIQIVLILLIGGARSAIGPILGSIVFFVLPDLVSIDPVSTQIFYGAALIAIVLVSPEGLVPRAAAAIRHVWQRKTVAARTRASA